jgi:acyl carrier protein
MATESEVRSDFYAIINHQFDCIHSPFDNPDDLRFTKDLKADEGSMILLFSELSEKFGIEINDFFHAYVPTVGDLANFILGRVPLE